MKQQINLYQDRLVERKVPLHAGMIFSVFVGCGILLFAGSAFLSWQQGKMQVELERLTQEQTTVLTDLQILKMNNPPRQNDPLIAQELKQKQAEFSGRKPLLAYLENFKAEEATGFSPLIKGFAAYPLKGVWLTNIHLDNAGHKILLAGSALKSDLIPAYVQHLGDRQVLNNQNFASLKVQQVNETKRQVDFRLESDFGGAGE